MRIHIIIEDGETEGLNVAPPAESTAASPEEVADTSSKGGTRPATPLSPRRQRLSGGAMKSAALGRKRIRTRKETTGPQEDFEDIAAAVADSVDQLPFTPRWMRRRRVSGD